MQYQLRFSPTRIAELANRYVERNSDRDAEDQIINGISLTTKEQGFYSKSDFLKVCYWKSPRTQKYCAANDESYILEVTSTALKTTDERLRVEVLTLLDGVDWPTASVLLHFGHTETYPILDFRALWSLSIEEPNAYKFPFWLNYVLTCRKIAEENKVAMRTLDRALWQYSSDNQR